VRDELVRVEALELARRIVAFDIPYVAFEEASLSA
jgi:hypothetical protein